MCLVTVLTKLVLVGIRYWLEWKVSVRIKVIPDKHHDMDTYITAHHHKLMAFRLEEKAEQTNNFHAIAQFELLRAKSRVRYAPVYVLRNSA